MNARCAGGAGETPASTALRGLQNLCVQQKARYLRQRVMDGDQLRSVGNKFAAAWAAPQLDRFIDLLHPNVTLLQPVTKPIRGRAAAREEFARLLAWLPDLCGTVDRIAIVDDTLLIAWRLRFSLGASPYELRIVDRIVVADGLILEREAYYDSLGLMIALLARPSAWTGYWRYRGYLPR